MSDSETQSKTPASHEESRKRGVFRIGEGAEMTYKRPSDQVMDGSHTLVEKVHRGKGVAQQLYHAMVGFARKNQRKVIATCPFVVAMFEQNPADQDVLQ